MDNAPILRQIPEAILPWYGANARDLPWRRDREPYPVWLSEIMLQQTRVEAVRGYYTRFLQALPTIAHLAEVDDDRLMKLWEGLGYYSRARNLKKAARIIQDKHGGAFPQTYEEIIALPGIGAYTAGAIASICFGLPRPAVDGNVLRVYARLTATADCVDLPAVKRRVEAELTDIYTRADPGGLSQALMELGATVCVPKGAPKCSLCPLGGFCRSRAAGTQLDYPVKAAKKARRVEEKTVFILTVDDALAVEKREGDGLLGGLWALPSAPGTLDEAAALARADAWGVRPRALERASRKKHIFTHVEWRMTGYYIHCGHRSPQFIWADEGDRDQAVALPTAFRQFIS